MLNVKIKLFELFKPLKPPFSLWISTTYTPSTLNSPLELARFPQKEPSSRPFPSGTQPLTTIISYLLSLNLKI